MKRRLAALVAPLGLLALFVGAPAHAATEEGTVLAGVDYFGETEGGATLNAFVAACETGQAEGFMGTPLNGIDAQVFDLKSEKMGAFAVKGPGADPVGPPLPEIGQVPSYDLDLYFFTESCDNANDIANRSNRCFSQKESPDEKTPCISGYKQGTKVRGARYVLVVAALNLTGGPINFTLTTP